MKALHGHLVKKYRWYSSWHDFSHHSKVHFFVFILIALGFASSLVTKINYEYASASADQTGASTAAVSFRANLQNLNTQFLQAVRSFNSAKSADKQTALDNLISAAQQRRQAMLTAIQSNPGEVLIQGLPKDVLGHVPSEVSALVEQRTSEVGKLQAIHVDGVNQQDGAIFNLITSHGTVSLHFKEDPTGEDVPLNFMTGDLVKADGVEIGDSMALSAKDLQNNSLKAAALSGTFGQFNTLVMLLNFQDNLTQPITPTAMSGVVFTNSQSISNYDLDASYGQTSLTGTVTNWMVMPLSSSTCNNSTIESAANSAATAAGYVLSNYQRFVYAFPSNNNCTSSALNGGVWAGLGEIGGQHAWINGEFDVRVIGHEMGHNFGLYHSHYINCGTVAYATSGCSFSEYGDNFDLMGSSSYGHFNAYQKERLGWLNFNSQPPIQSVTASGTYTIAPYETKDTGVKALKVLQSSANNQYYYVEYRQKIGFDSNVSYAGNFVEFRIASPSNANSSDLLNINPGVSQDLAPGQSYYDPSAGVTFTVVSATSTGAVVNVSFGQIACVRANPTISVSPASQSSQSGQGVTYFVTVTNNNNSGCTPDNFNLTSSALPSGFTVGFTSSSISLGSGTSLTTTFGITSPSTATDSSNTFTLTATNAADSTFVGSTAATYVISNPVIDTTPPTVSIISPTNGSTVSGNSTIISVVASDNVGVANVKIYIDGVLKATDTTQPYSYKWALKKVAAGSHTISAVAVDAAGNQATATTTVNK